MTSGRGVLKMFGAALGGSKIQLTLADDAGVVHQEEMPAPALVKHPVQWKDLTVALWWPNGHGEQKLYSLTCDLLNVPEAHCTHLTINKMPLIIKQITRQTV